MKPNTTQPVLGKYRLLGLPIVIAATLGLLGLALNRDKLPPFLPIGDYLNSLISYQLITLALTAVVLIALRLLGPHTFQRYFRRGQTDAPTEPVRALGINTKGDETWRQVGRNFAIIITAVTAIFLFFSLLRGQSIGPIPWASLLLVPLLAASNAFVEEMITRFGVVVSLDGFVPRGTIYLVSAVLFGGVHYFGTPGGLIGVAMAGFLGWLLAKSIIETQGVFWAWFIHFLQDVVIFGALFLVNPV